MLKLYACGFAVFVFLVPAVSQKLDRPPAPISVLSNFPGVVLALAFSPDGRAMATGTSESEADVNLKVWDTSNWKQKQAIPHGSVQLPDGRSITADFSVLSLAFSPDAAKLLVGTGDLGHIRMLDTTTWQEERALRGEGSIVYIGFSLDGKEMYTVHSNGTQAEWETATWSVAGLDRHGYQLKRYPSKPIIPIAAAPATHFGNQVLKLAVGEDNDILLLLQSSGGLPATLKGHKDLVISVAFGAKLLASGSADKSVNIWNAQDSESETGTYNPIGKPIRTLRDLKSDATAVAFSHDDKILAVGIRTGEVFFWDTLTWHQVGSIQAHLGPVWRLLFSPDNKLLATAGQDSTVKIWPNTF